MSGQAAAMALFSRSKWIWPESHRWDIHNSYALFRKTFHLPTLPVKAPLLITADQSYQLYINGHYVCQGPARGFQARWPYDEVDIREHLREGENVLGVRAHNPGFSNFQYLTQGYAGLLVAAKWGDVEIHSNAGWRGRRQSGINSAAAPSSLQLFCQEHIDLRMEDPNWMHPKFDDSQWTSRLAEHPWNGMPWYALEERGIPMLDEHVIPAGRIIGASRGPCAPGYESTRDVARIRYAEGLSHEAASIDGAEIIIHPTGRSGFRSYLIDFGKTVVGRVGFEILGAMGGEILDTLHVETIDEETLTPDYVPDKHCRMAFGHRLICCAGEQRYTFYHIFGFRYMVLTLRDCTSEVTLRPYLMTAMYPLEKRGAFSSSDIELTRIWEACAWTQRVCSIDAFVDTPWREQAQWWGDARVQAKNTFFYSGDTRLFRRGIRQIAAQTGPNGLTYGHAPTMAHNCILPDFTLIWIITLWDYYWQTGSLEPFLKHQDTIRGSLAYFEEKTDAKTGLVGYDDRYWLFLDWTPLFKDGYSTVCNLWLLIALQKLADLSVQAGFISDHRRLSEWAARLRRSLATLMLPNGLLSDGLTFDGELVPSTSIHAQTLAILASFQPEHDASRLAKILLTFIREEVTLDTPPSCYWITYVFEVLTAHGYGAEVVEFIRRKWAPMADHGTTWEVFEPRVGDESFSHAWSAHPLFHLMQTIGGIRQGAVGWKEIQFQPVFHGETSDTTVPTPLGDIRSAWKRAGAFIEVSLSLPDGVSALVTLPGFPLEKVTNDSTWRVSAHALEESASDTAVESLNEALSTSW